MNDHEIIENLDLIMNLDLVVDFEDNELIENLQEISGEGETPEGGNNE